LGARRWVDAARYPLSEATPRTYYLGPGATLTTTAPRTRAGADTLAFVGASSPCALQSDQFGTGPVQLALEAGQLPPNPCAQDDRSIQVGPGALTYTTAPMPVDTIVAGPVDATIYATSTRPEVELLATLEDVAPGGTSTPITSGALLGSLRARD